MVLKRRSKRSARAAGYVGAGRKAELAGDFRSASVWYKKAGVAYGRTARGRMWTARSADLLKHKHEMGTLFQGTNKMYAGNFTTPARGTRRIGKRHKRRVILKRRR